MKHLHVRVAGLALAAVVGFALEAEVRPLVVEGAPFPLTVAEWTPPARDFPVTDYGAKPDGTRRNVSWLGTPFSRPRNSLRRASCFLP